MQNLLKAERPKGHCIQVPAFMDHDGTIYYSPKYSLCQYGHCITLTEDVKSIFSEVHSGYISVCPDCMEKVRKLNENLVKLGEGFL